MKISVRIFAHGDQLDSLCVTVDSADAAIIRHDMLKASFPDARYTTGFLVSSWTLEELKDFEARAQALGIPLALG
jgi:hypothetical protein